jgi:hypothetical protein
MTVRSPHRNASPLVGWARDLLALEILRLRAAADRRLSSLALGALALLWLAVIVVVGRVRLVLGLSAAVSAALDAAPWAGDVVVGLALPALMLATVILAHRRRAVRRLARAASLGHGPAEDPGPDEAAAGVHGSDGAAARDEASDDGGPGQAAA